MRLTVATLTSGTRPAVAAMALGIAAAAVDCVHAARAVDATGDGRPASAAKARACELAEDATLEAAELLGPSARAESPMLPMAQRASGAACLCGRGPDPTGWRGRQRRISYGSAQAAIMVSMLMAGPA